MRKLPGSTLNAGSTVDTCSDTQREPRSRRKQVRTPRAAYENVPHPRFVRPFAESVWQLANRVPGLGLLQ